MNQNLLANRSASELPVTEVKVSHHLTGDVALYIHTKKAQSLCQGSWEYRNMGLFQFAAVMTVIYQARDQGDPYADWTINKIRTELEKIDTTIKQTIQKYEQALQEFRNLEVQIFGSRHPQKLLLEFATPLSYIAAYAIADLDYLLRQAYTFRRLSIIPESQETPYGLLGVLRSALIKSRQWHHTGITSQDIREKNQKAERAQTLMGKLPKRILNE